MINKKLKGKAAVVAQLPKLPPAISAFHIRVLIQAQPAHSYPPP